MIQNKQTFQVMICGLIAAIAMNTTFFGLTIEQYWPWSLCFPLSWLGGGLNYMIIFFHEIGHTICAWLFGFFTIPMFDFKHGGGWAYSFGAQNILILIMVWGLLLYGIWHFRWNKWYVMMFIGTLLFSLAFAFSDYQQPIISFMGPAAEPFIAGFLLYRALFDLAPRGWFERFLNAAFGFGIAFHVWIQSYGLLNNSVYRDLYFKQKSAHGAGDFDKIVAQMPGVSFTDVVGFWSALTVICFMIPFIAFAYARAHHQT